MPSIRVAYMPLITHLDYVPDGAVEAGVALAGALGCELHATTFAVDMPQVAMPFGGMLLNMPEMIRAAEEHSQLRCRNLQALIHEKAGAQIRVTCSTKHAVLGREQYGAALESRVFDVVVLPWSKESVVVRDFAQALVFDAGRPSILVPPGTTSAPIRHVAVAWDASRVAAQALGDALSLLPDDCRITVLTAGGDKTLPGKDLAEALAASLQRRGHSAEVKSVDLAGRKIAVALQEAALEVGAQMLIMGAFGHSRLRDFVLGGATTGVFENLRMPVLLSH